MSNALARLSEMQPFSTVADVDYHQYEIPLGDHVHTKNHAVVTFKNGWVASIIDDGYGGRSILNPAVEGGLFEMAFWTTSNVYFGVPKIKEFEDCGDSVLGYLGAEQVMDIIERVGNLPTVETRSIDE